MEPSLTGEQPSVDDRHATAALALGLAFVMVDEAFVVASPCASESFLALPVFASLRTLVAVVALVLPIVAIVRVKRLPTIGDVAVLAVLGVERTFASATHRPWVPGRLDGAREALTAAATVAHGGVPWGGLAAWTLGFALVFCAWKTTRTIFTRRFSTICVAVTLLFASGLTLVYASGAGETWFEASCARASAPCPAPQRALEPPKEMQNGSENRDPK